MSEQLGHQLHVHSSISCDRSFTEKADICEDGFKDDFCQKTNWSVIISLPLKPSDRHQLIVWLVHSLLFLTEMLLS